MSDPDASHDDAATPPKGRARAAVQAVRGQLQRVDPVLAARIARKVAVFGVTRRLLRTVPLLGPGLAAYAGYSNIKRKGWIRGGVDTALDLTPVVGPLKAVFELFRGELIAPADPSFERERIHTETDAST